ncbi:MAG TPA: hypothetical protein VF572_07045 [Candidatus Saccharimonadales bacterium]|jgi:hypothetical protein
MVENNTNTTIEKVCNIGAHVGVAVMMGATLTGMLESAYHEGHRMAMTLQPVYSSVSHGPAAGEQGNEMMRRTGGKEEIRHTSATFGAVMRTHFVAGTL